MKTIKISESALAVNHLFPVTLSEFKAIKISREQALSFSFADQRSSYEVLKAKYAKEELKDGECYEGYILFNNGCVNRVAYLHGYFRKEAPEQMFTFPVWLSFPPKRTESIWHRVYRQENDKETLGELRYVFTLGTLAFEKYLPQKDAEKLRKKLIKSVIDNTTVKINQQEDEALHNFLDSRYKNIVKKVNPKIKKMRVIKENLATEDLFLGPWKMLKIIKVSEEQARRFNFCDEYADLETLLAKYGEENVLSENEYYTGFAILCDDEYCNSAIFMEGRIVSEIDEDSSKQVYYIRNQYPDGRLPKPCAKHIRSFGMFKGKKGVSDKANERLRQKLIEASISGDFIEFTEKEVQFILQSTQFSGNFFEITDVIEENE